MNSLEDLEKIINSELATKVISSKINHNQIYLSIDDKDLLDVILFIVNIDNNNKDFLPLKSQNLRFSISQLAWQ